jgi:hypothetical protein
MPQHIDLDLRKTRVDDEKIVDISRPARPCPGEIPSVTEDSWRVGGVLLTKH